MNWIRQNTFLAGYIAVSLVGAIGLGVLVYLQYDKYSTVAEQLASQSKKLRGLQTLPLFPSEENLKKIKAQRQQLDQGVEQLRNQLAKMTLPAEPMAPQQFQDKLRSTVLALVEAARQHNVKLPEKFYLGFDTYQTLPPKPDATLALATQLAGMEVAYKIMIDKKVIQIEAPKRPILNQEESAKPLGGAAQPAKVSPAGKADLIEKIPFEIAFKAEQSQVRSVLNALAKSEGPFFILRSVQIANDHPKAPSKFEAAQFGAATAPGAESSKPAASKQIDYVLGTEKVDVTAQLEIVSFKPSPRK